MASSPNRICLGFALIVAAVVGAWCYWIQPIQSRRQWHFRVEADIRSLATKRPNNVARGSWEFLVGWTVNLSANCGPFPRKNVVQRELDDFAAEFERKLQAEPTFEIIDWIWDEFVRLTEYGPSYDRFRPTRPDSGWDRAEIGCCGMPVD